MNFPSSTITEKEVKQMLYPRLEGGLCFLESIFRGGQTMGFVGIDEGMAEICHDSIKK